MPGSWKGASGGGGGCEGHNLEFGGLLFGLSQLMSSEQPLGVPEEATVTMNVGGGGRHREVRLKEAGPLPSHLACVESVC